MPNEPGGARSDISGVPAREAWIEEHPEADSAIVSAIREAIFVPGMTIEHRDVISNPVRKGATGNAYWRSRVTGDETRYQWFLAGQWEPFVDGRGRLVCELVFVRDILTRVRFCGPASEGGASNAP